MDWGCDCWIDLGQVTDYLGWRYALFWAAVMTLLSVVLQTAAQYAAMFVITRVLVGYGTSASTLTRPTYLAETLPYQRRAWGLGVLNDCYYVGMIELVSIRHLLIHNRRIDCSWGHIQDRKYRINLVLAHSKCLSRYLQHPPYHHSPIHSRISPVAGLPGTPGGSSHCRGPNICRW